MLFIQKPDQAELTEHILKAIHKAELPFIEKIREKCEEHEGRVITDDEFVANMVMQVSGSQTMAAEQIEVKTFFYKDLNVGSFKTVVTGTTIYFDAWNPEANSKNGGHHTGADYGI